MAYKIELSDEIAAGTFQRMKDEVKKAGTQPILLSINSPGGSVTEGAACLAILSAHKPGVTVNILGLAASMASVLATVGNPVVMAENAVWMMHDPLLSEVSGNAEELRKAAQTLDTFKQTLVTAYVKKSGKTADEISRMMREETWMTAEQALAAGFVDRIAPPSNAVASITKWQSRFPKMSAFMPKTTKPKATSTVDEATAIIKRIERDLAEKLALSRIQQQEIATLQAKRKKAISLAEFRTLPPRQKSQLMREGVRLTD